MEAPAKIYIGQITGRPVMFCSKERISPDDIEYVLAFKPQPNLRTDIENMELILTTICAITKVSPFKVKEQNRKKPIRITRHFFYYFCWIYTTIPVKEIGWFVGGHDHSSVIHGRDALRDHIKNINESILNYSIRIENEIAALFTVKRLIKK